MLDARYKKVARALKLYGACLTVGVVGAGGTLSLQLARPLLGEAVTVLLGLAVLALDAVGVFGFGVGTLAILVYATVPSESGARTSAVVAAVSSFLQLGIAMASLVALLGFDELGLYAAMLEVPLALITLMAMARSLRQLGLYVRADEIWDRANRLFVGLVLLVLLWIGAIGMAMVFQSGGTVEMEQLAMVVVVVALLFTWVGSLMIALAYTVLVVKAGKQLDELIYE